MKQIVYGVPEKYTPQYGGFSIDSDGSMSFDVNGIETFQLEGIENICWGHLFDQSTEKLVTKEESRRANLDCDPFNDGRPIETILFDRYGRRLWKKLENYCHEKSKTERAFFSMYCDMCLCDPHPESTPAMFPGVYINWLSSKPERQNKSIPFIVDFAVKHSVFGVETISIIEIDGPSHYSDWNERDREYIVSERRYTDHLKKDRWLRKRGFNVIRISNFEIKEIMAQKDKIERFYGFFKEVFGWAVYPD